MKLEDVLQTTDTDIALILETGDELPPVVVPVSDRAKTLFIAWGMDAKVQGIVATFHPDELIKLCPLDWTMVMADLDDGLYVFQEIALPSGPVVVH